LESHLFTGHLLEKRPTYQVIIIRRLTMKKIAVEEHFRGPYYIDYVQSRKRSPRLERIADDEGKEMSRWRL